MDDFVTVATVGEIPRRSAKIVKVGLREIAIFRDGEEILAIDNVCPHAGGALGAGSCKRGVVYCPIHLWGFDLRTGACDTIPELKADVFETRVEGNDVRVRLTPKANSE